MAIFIVDIDEVRRSRWLYEGKKRCLGLGVKDNPAGRAHAKQKIAQIEMDIMAGYYDPTLLKYKPQKLGKNPTQVTAVELFEKYAAHRQQERGLSHSSKVRFKGIASKLSQFLGDRAANKVTESIASDVVARWSESISTRTIKERLCDLCACWDWAKGKYHIADTNPWAECLERVKSKGTNKPKRKEPFTIDELRAIIAAFASHPRHKHYHDFAVFLSGISCRPGEVVGLTWKNVAPDYSSAWICQSISRGHKNAWFLHTNIPLIITEGAKKACSLLSAGYPAIALNGVWGWGTNDRDLFGNVEKDDLGHNLKILHPDLETFIDFRELILAFDRDSKPGTVRMVEAAKAAFVRAIADDDSPITQLTWKNAKGIDDYLATKGVKALDRLYANRREVKPPQPQKEERVKNNDRLLEIARTATYFHTPDRVAYADAIVDGNRHTYAVRSKAFRLWLTGEYLESEDKGIGSQTLQDTLNTLEAIAICRGETREVHLRVAEYQGKHYLDLGTSDWKAIEIDASGWRIVTDPPVRFWRPESMLPLPIPIEGGKLEELRELINVDDDSWVSICTFLLFSFMPNKTYPVLILSAVRGSGKTTAAEIIKGLIDPCKAPLIKITGEIAIWFIANRSEQNPMETSKSTQPEGALTKSELVEKLGKSRQSIEQRRDKGTLEEWGYRADKIGSNWYYFPLDQSNQPAP